MASSLTEMNTEAVAALRKGDVDEACRLYERLEAYRKKHHLTHVDLHTIHCNWASALLRRATGPNTTAASDLDPETQCHQRESALHLAEAALRHVEASMARLGPGHFVPSKLLCLLRKGEALLALGRPRAAAAVCEEGLALDPDHTRLRGLYQSAIARQLSDANTVSSAPGAGAATNASEALADGVLAPVVDAPGSALQLQLITDGAPIERLPAATSIHRLKAASGPLAPLAQSLLHPKQAEKDASLKEGLNFVSIQTDLAKPKEHLFGLLADTRRLELFSAALRQTIAHVDTDLCMDPRVLHVGAGTGVLSLSALAAGAKHVTLVERWTYLAKASKDVLEANATRNKSVRILNRKPTDLRLHDDVPIPCNVLLLDGILDASLLMTGLLPSIDHILRERLLVPDSIAIPMSVTVYAQPVYVSTELPADIGLGAGLNFSPCESESDGRRKIDLSAMPIGANAYLPLGCSAVPPPRSAEDVATLRRALVPLGAPVELWTFRLTEKNDTASRKSFSVPCTAPGLFNAVLLFYRLQLTSDLSAASWSPGFLDISTPSTIALNGDPSGANAQLQDDVLPSLGGACLFPLPAYSKEPLQPGATISFLASHNTTRIAFEAIPTKSESGESEPRALVPRAVPDPRTPPALGTVLWDTERLQAYSAALSAALDRQLDPESESDGLESESPVVLDLASGSGVLGLLAAHADPSVRVIQADLSEPVCTATRATAARCGVLTRTSVVHRDASTLKLGVGIPLHAPPTIAVTDLFDAGLTGLNVQTVLRQLELRQVLQEGCVVIPRAAQLFCVGVEIGLPRIRRGTLQGGESEVDGRACESESDELVDLEPLRRFLWSDACDTVSLATLPHRVLTRPVKVTDMAFTPGAGTGAAGLKEGFLQLHAMAQGTLNAFVMWFELAMDDQTTLVAAPRAFIEDLFPTDASPGPRTARYFAHSFGQALYYLDRQLSLTPGATFSVLARREGPAATLGFQLRPGLGEWVPRPEWLEEWGGGTSVENPHVQRARYLQLLTGEFLQRAKSGRFPSVEEELRVLATHCGSLGLDPWALERTMRELILMESVQREGNFGPLASLEALLPTRRIGGGLNL